MKEATCAAPAFHLPGGYRVNLIAGRFEAARGRCRRAHRVFLRESRGMRRAMNLLKLADRHVCVDPRQVLEYSIIRSTQSEPPARSESGLTLASVMPRVSRLKLPPLDLGKESLGQRISRLRKERGFTQVELSERIGLIQSLVCDYEKDRLRLSAEMALRFALALDMTVDDLLRPKGSRAVSKQPSRRVLRRLEKIDTLPAHQQNAVLKSIDMMLKGIAS